MEYSDLGPLTEMNARSILSGVSFAAFGLSVVKNREEKTDEDLLAIFRQGDLIRSQIGPGQIQIAKR